MCEKINEASKQKLPSRLRNASLKGDLTARGGPLARISPFFFRVLIQRGWDSTSAPENFWSQEKRRLR